MVSMKKDKNYKMKKIFVYLALIVLIIVIDIPVINMIGVSLKSSKEIMTNNGLLPHNPTLINLLMYLINQTFYYM